MLTTAVKDGKCVENGRKFGGGHSGEAGREFGVMLSAVTERASL
jgi:hypothetical protein